ncbi:MAG: dihydrolipoyl dehydrogenase [bacterium]
MDRFDYAVIGSGPAGYVSAIRAAQLGMKVVLVEKNPTLGGTCLNVGCIPSKALLESSEHFAAANHKLAEFGVNVSGVKMDVPKMIARKAEIVKTLTDGIALLMKKNKVTVLGGHGRLVLSGKFSVEANGKVTEYEAEHIVLALGSMPVELPFLKFDGIRVIHSTHALDLTKAPKSLLVIGAGAIGLEMGSVWSRLGSEVTFVEMMPQIAPFADKQMAKVLQRSLESQGLAFLLDTKVLSADVQKTQVRVTVVNNKGEKQELVAETVLVAVGRKTFTADCGLEQAGVEMDGPRVKIEDSFRTNLKNVYAIGDLVRGPMLAHKGEDEGVAVAEIVAGLPGHVNYDAIPNVIYTWPELASVGMHEDEAKEKGFEVRTGKYMFRPNGRALTMGEPEGMVKLIADVKTDRLLGATIVGARASDMIAELVIALEFRASSEDVARTTHAHPSLSEIIKEAALAVDKRSIHG